MQFLETSGYYEREEYGEDDFFEELRLLDACITMAFESGLGAEDLRKSLLCVIELCF